jgi:REP element-mobilizing transposase RayT
MILMAVRFGYRIYAFSLMTDLIHLLVVFLERLRGTEQAEET